MRSQAVAVTIDLARVHAAAIAIAAAVRVPLFAVVKADAYGLGAARVAAVLADVVARFCVFDLAEAQRLDLWRRTRRPVLALGPPDERALADYRRLQLRPAVAGVDAARALRRVFPVLCVDTGMQRFACPAAETRAALAAGACAEAFTHATRSAQIARLLASVGRRGLMLHAAASSLLGDRSARLDAVRPGLALYRDAVRVSTRLVECRTSRGPIGYRGFTARRHGVIPLGYAHGLRAGPCRIGGQQRRIREVGMQTAFVEIGAGDRPGDAVVLLGDGLGLDTVAAAWRTSEHETLIRLAGSGRRTYQE